jgi:hypothetical protein
MVRLGHVLPFEIFYHLQEISMKCHHTVTLPQTTAPANNLCLIGTVAPLTSNGTNPDNEKKKDVFLLSSSF